MKKTLSIILCLLLIAASVIVIAACGKKENENEPTSSIESSGETVGGWTEPETPDSTVAAVDGNMKTYYEMKDGTWMCDGIIYQYRLEIKGRMPAAEADSCFVYLSNIKDISFEQAYKAGGVSSNSEDYFSPEEAVLVEMN